MTYPTLVYRCPGAHFAHDGQTYDYRPVDSDESLSAALAAGWAVSLVDAVKAVTLGGHEDDQADDSAPATRAELESMANELAIKFDGRTTDTALLRKIEAAIPEKS